MQMWIQQLISNGPVITDGAWGTQMQARGLPIGDCPEAWNLTCPERVSEVAHAYLEAGSQVILTNTFGANRIALERYGLTEKVEEINREGIRISREAAGHQARVFASLGPTGQVLQMGYVSETDVASAYAEQAQILAAGGADALVIETMSDLAEAKIALAAAKETGLPVVACMTYGAGKDGDRTMMGVTPEKAAVELEAASADVIGANCGVGVAQMQFLCARLRAATALPLWIKPNAGLPELIGGHAVYLTTPQEFVAYGLALIHAGADFIGGCCGTSPDYIRTLNEALATAGYRDCSPAMV
jgi:methionine synthase I (cobalamin-dependent)